MKEIFVILTCFEMKFEDHIDVSKNYILRAFATEEQCVNYLETYRKSTMITPRFYKSYEENYTHLYYIDCVPFEEINLNKA